MASYAYGSPLSTTHRGFWSRSKHNSIPNLFGLRSPKPSPVLLHSPPLRSSSAKVFSRPRKNSSAVVQTKLFKSKKTPEHGDKEGDEIDEDAFEALFSQLEEDLKADETFSDEEDDEITEDDLARFEQELEEALGDEEESDEILEGFPYKSDDLNNSDDEEELQPKLKNWQLRHLAHALKIGRRKTSIKNLSAELGLERARVLELLREPPPNLLLMCASLPDKVVKKPEPVDEPVESTSDSVLTISKSEPKEEAPIHVMQTRWSMNKRLKKVQFITLERVYARTKRPTNAMISSIVHVTNLPWKRVVKWFEDKRLEDGVPVHPEPFHRTSLVKTV